jgi:hypothetical protein
MNLQCSVCWHILHNKQDSHSSQYNSYLCSPKKTTINQQNGLQQNTLSLLRP